jgi:NADPH2:quinone reductase
LSAPTRVRAVGIPRPGGPEVLSVIEHEVRAPARDEVRVAVRAAAVNPTDIVVRRRGLEDQHPPWVPGMDLAGVVESVGEGVSRLAVGDEVMAAVTPRRPGGGAQAELVVVPAASAVAIPEKTTVRQAATLPMNGLTAVLALEHLDLAEGQTLAVSGGAGLLASYAIPMAKLRGIRVVADAKPEDEALVRSFGADAVLPRGAGFPAAVRDVAPAGADGFLDTALLGQSALPAIRDRGRLAIVRRLQGLMPERGIEVREVYVFDVLERTDWLEQLRELASRGALSLRVAGEYPPERAAEAHRAMDAGGLRGRALIVF